MQGFLVDGGKRAADNDLKERRQKKKKAAEKRLKVLGEALGHVDDEDGVLVKVYDDIQTELQAISFLTNFLYEINMYPWTD